MNLIRKKSPEHFLKPLKKFLTLRTEFFTRGGGGRPPTGCRTTAGPGPLPPLPLPHFNPLGLGERSGRCRCWVACGKRPSCSGAPCYGGMASLVAVRRGALCGTWWWGMVLSCVLLVQGAARLPHPCAADRAAQKPKGPSRGGGSSQQQFYSSPEPPSLHR